MPDDAAYITVPITTDQATLRDDAIAELQSLVPGWNPDAGDLARWVLEACAILAAETRDVAAQVPALAFAAWGEDMLGLPAREAAAATAPSTWTAVDDAGYTIPAGTTVGIRTAGDTLAGFRVASDVAIPNGSTATAAGEVLLEAVEPGADASGITGSVELIDALAGISAVALTEATSGGEDAETGAEYLDRLRIELQSLTFTPILPADFARQALTVAGVGRATASEAGTRTVAVAVAGDDGLPCSSGVKSAVDDLLQGRRETNFVVTVGDPGYHETDVEFEAVAIAGYDVDDVEAAAVDAVTAYLDPATWGVQQSGSDPSWAEMTYVRYLEVAQVINQVEGVNYIVSLTVDAGTSDVALPAPAGLPTAGTITGTVTAP